MPTTVDLSALMAKAKSRAQQEPARPVSDLTSIMARAKARASATAQPAPQDPAQAPADMSGADMAFQAARTAGVEPLPGYALPGAAFASGIAGAAGGASRLAQSAVQFAQDLPTLGRILVTAPVAKAMDVAQDPASLVRPGPQPASSMSRQMMESAIVGTPSEQISRQVVGAVADPIKESLGGFATQARQVERGIDAAANPGAPFDSVKGTVYAAIKSAPIMGTSMGLSLAGAPWAGAALMFATEGGDAAEQAYQYRLEQGDSPEAALQTAFMSGVGTGAINAALEQGGVQRTMSFLRLGEISRRLMGKADQNTVVRVLSRYLADAGVEGGEEIAQGIVSDVAQTVIAGDPSANPLTVDSLERRGVEGGLGFLMGLGGGAASVPSLYQQAQQELPTQTVDRLTKEAQAEATAGPEATSTQTTAPPLPVPSPVPGETPAQIVTRLEREAQARMQERAGAQPGRTPETSPAIETDAGTSGIAPATLASGMEVQPQPRTTGTPQTDALVPVESQAQTQEPPAPAPAAKVSEPDAPPPVGAPPGTDQPTPERAGRTFATLNERIDAETELAAIEDSLTTKDKAAAPAAAGVVNRPGERSRADRLLDRLAAVASSAVERMRARRKERGFRLYSNPLPDPRDVIDASIVVAARATTAGIKGGRALTKLTNETIAAVSPHLQNTADRVRKLARALIRKAGEKGEQFEAAVGAALATPRTKRSKVKGLVNQTTGVDAQPAEGAEELKDEYRSVKRVAGRIYRAGYQDAVAKGKADLKAYVRELRSLAAWERQNRADQEAQERSENAAALQAATTEARQQRQRADAAERRQANQARVQEIRSAVAQLAKALPPSLRFKYLTAAVATTTGGQLAKVGMRMQVDLNVWESRQSLKRIKKLSARENRLLFPVGPERQRFLGLINQADQARQWLRGMGKVGTTRAGRWSLSRRLNATTAEILQDMHAMVSDAKAERGEDVAGKKTRAFYERQTMLEAVKKTAQLSAVDSGDKDMSVLKRMIAADLHLGRVLKALDNDWWGKGPFYRGYRKLVSSRRNWLADKHTFTDAFETVVKKHGHKSLMHFLVENDGILGPANQGKGIGIELGGRELSRAEAMYVYAMDPDTKDSMGSGQTFNFLDAPESAAFSITPQLLKQISDALTAEDRAIVDEAKALYQARYFDRLSDVNMQLNGTHLERVDGYFGVKRNIRKSPTIRDPRSWREAMQPALENAAMLQGRTGGRTPIFIGSFGREMLLRSDAASKVVNVAIPLRNAFGTMLHPQVREQIADRFGAAAVRRIEGTLVEYGVGQNEPDAMLKPIQWANSNVSRVAVQLWVPTMLRNLGGISKLAHVFDMADVAKHIDAVFDSDVWRKVRALPELRERWSHGLYTTVTPTQSSLDVGGLNRKELAKATVRQIAEAAKEARNLLSPRGRRRFGEAMRGADRAWRAFNQTLDWANWFDGAAARVAWAVLDAKAKKDHPDWGDERREEWVGRETERVFYDIANTNDVLHSSYWAQRGRANPLIGMALTFTSDINQSRNILIEGWKRGTLVRSTAAVAGSWLWSAGVTALVLGIRAMLAGGDDDEYLKKLGSAAANEAASQVPLGRVPAAAFEYYVTRRLTSSFSDTPLHGVVDAMAGGISDVGKGVARGPGKSKSQKLTGTELVQRGSFRAFVELNRLLGNPFSPYLNEVRKMASP